MRPPPLLGEHRSALFAALIALALVQAGGAAMAAFATRTLFGALDTETTPPWGALAALAGSGLLIAIARIAFRTLGERIGQDFVASVRRTLFDHASRTWPRDLARRRVGYMALRFVGDLTALRDWPARGLPVALEALVVLPAAIVVLFVLDPVFGDVMLGVTVVAAGAIVASAAPLLKAHRTLRSARAKLAAEMAERLPIAADLAAFARRSREMKRLGRLSNQVARSAIDRRRRAEILRAVPDGLGGLAAALLIWRAFEGDLATGTVAAGLAALGLGIAPLRNVMTAIDRAGAYFAAHAKLADLLARPGMPERSDSAERLPSRPASVTYDGAAVEDAPAVDLEVPAGSRAVLPAGSRPAALFRATRGLEPLNGGRILLGGKPVQHLSGGSLRRGVMEISPDPVILKGTVRRTITLALSDRPDDARLLKRIESAGLWALLERLGGLDARLAEGGRTILVQDRVALSALAAAVASPGLVLVSAPARTVPPEVRAWLDGHPATVVFAHG